ncbi:MAG TPA: M4 family metallopeptidase, partial [Pyrinomonadaceae bacterium]
MGLADAGAELELSSVTEDDRGVTGVAMRQVHKGVPVFGGTLLVMLDPGGGPLEIGRPEDERVSRTGTSIDFVTPREDKYVPGVYATIYADARAVHTLPTLSPAEAIRAAERELGYTGKVTDQPQAELVVMPHRIRNSGPEDAAGGASLVYRVELFVDSGAESARWLYFIDARDGHVAWHYDAMERGTGQSLYSGFVGFPSGYYYVGDWRWHCGGWHQNYGYWTWDGSGQYGMMEAWDLNDQIPESALAIGSGDFWRGDADDSNWGNSSRYYPYESYAGECDWLRERAGVEAMFDMALTWDYFLTRHGWRGIDNRGYRMFSRVHYGSNREVAQWNGMTMDFGDGHVGRPWVSLDTVGHEWTHGIRDSTSKILTHGESGASNESFADIFGTMVEFLANNQTSRPDFLIGEDFKNPPIRNLADPPALGHRDHYNRRDYPGYCTPSAANQNCGIYSNAGIQNKAWYLMAVGG